MIVIGRYSHHDGYEYRGAFYHPYDSMRDRQISYERFEPNGYPAITICPPVNALRAWLRFNRTVRGL